MIPGPPYTPLTLHSQNLLPEIKIFMTFTFCHHSFQEAHYPDMYAREVLAMKTEIAVDRIQVGVPLKSTISPYLL